MISILIQFAVITAAMNLKMAKTNILTTNMKQEKLEASYVLVVIEETCLNQMIIQQKSKIYMMIYLKKL